MKLLMMNYKLFFEGCKNERNHERNHERRRKSDERYDGFHVKMFIEIN